MPQINITISGRTYLAARLDFKMTEMRVRFGEIGDQRITIMAALTFVDEAGEAERRAGALAAEIEELRRAEQALATAGETVAVTLDDVAGRIARVAEQIEKDA